MHSDENAGLDLIAPNREIRMIGVYDFFRINLWILWTIVRHRNDHDFRDLRGNFQRGLCFFHCMIVPGPE
jgi:hypothetical protein